MWEGWRRRPHAPARSRRPEIRSHAAPGTVATRGGGGVAGPERDLGRIWSIRSGLVPRQANVPPPLLLTAANRRRHDLTRCLRIGHRGTEHVAVVKREQRISGAASLSRNAAWPGQTGSAGPTAALTHLGPLFWLSRGLLGRRRETERARRASSGWPQTPRGSYRRAGYLPDSGGPQRAAYSCRPSPASGHRLRRRDQQNPDRSWLHSRRRARGEPQHDL